MNVFDRFQLIVLLVGAAVVTAVILTVLYAGVLSLSGAVRLWLHRRQVWK